MAIFVTHYCFITLFLVYPCMIEIVHFWKHIIVKIYFVLNVLIQFRDTKQFKRNQIYVHYTVHCFNCLSKITTAKERNCCLDINRRENRHTVTLVAL